MEILEKSPKWYDNLWAALMFFTRLPLWRLHEPPKESFKSVVEFWPLTGWLTAGVMAAVIYFGSMALPIEVTVLAAIAIRVLLTGALHEDGLCDFFDGMGGGTSRERILEIMKDSRIGTYGVLGIIIYMLLLFFTLTAMPPLIAALAVLAADPYAKMLSGQITQMMPYARKEEEAKSKTVYRRMSVPSAIGLFIQGIVPMALFLWFTRGQVDWQTVIFTPCLVMYVLYLLTWKKIRGYTGDCCGAFFLLIELSVYLSVLWEIYNA